MLSINDIVSHYIVKSCHACYIAIFFFFNDTATTEIYTLSLHDALPISARRRHRRRRDGAARRRRRARLGRLALGRPGSDPEDRKSTRLNSSHANISYAVFCLKKKKACKTCRKLRQSQCVARAVKQY